MQTELIMQPVFRRDQHTNSKELSDTLGIVSNLNSPQLVHILKRVFLFCG